jgi:hypothetical protein
MTRYPDTELERHRAQQRLKRSDLNEGVDDVKTASGKSSAVQMNYRVQVATYSILAPGASERTCDSDVYEHVYI